MTSSDPSDGSPPGRRRRSSFTDMFARPSIDTSTANSVTSNGPRTSSIASAMQQRARRMSITSVGLSGSPNGPSTASAFDTIRGSQVGQARPGANPGMGEEEAVEDADEVPPLNGEGSRPTSPTVGRRLSFGARAYRASSGASSNGDTGGSEGSDRSPNGTAGSPPGTKKEGFNWSENLRARAQRSSISAGSGNPSSFMPLPGMHAKSRSVADPGAAAAPAPPPPAPPPAQKRPDHFQERILKGDFYMD